MEAYCLYNIRSKTGFSRLLTFIYFEIRSNIWKCLKSFLKQRTQAVRIVDSGKVFESPQEEPARGVPQGSVLGLLRFIFFNT